MVPRKEFFQDDDSLNERPGKGRNYGKKEKSKRRFDSQEDFGITRKAKSRGEIDDDDFLENFDDDEFVDDDDLDFDDDDLDFGDDDDDDDDFEDDEDL